MAGRVSCVYAYLSTSILSPNFNSTEQLMFLQKSEYLTTALFRNTMWRATTKQSFQRTSSCGYRKSWYAGEWSKPVPMAKSAPTAATTALHRLLFAVTAVKCSAESTGTIAAANPSSGAASVDWSQPDRNATQESSMRWYWKMW